MSLELPYGLRREKELYMQDGQWVPLDEIKIKRGESDVFLRGDGTWVTLGKVVEVEDITEIYDYDS